MELDANHSCQCCLWDRAVKTDCSYLREVWLERVTPAMITGCRAITNRTDKTCRKHFEALWDSELQILRVAHRLWSLVTPQLDGLVATI